MSVAAETREDTASMTREHKFLSGNRGNLCVKEHNETSLRRSQTNNAKEMRVILTLHNAKQTQDRVKLVTLC